MSSKTRTDMAMYGSTSAVRGSPRSGCPACLAPKSSWPLTRRHYRRPVVATGNPGRWQEDHLAICVSPKRHDISRKLIRVWFQKKEAGALAENARTADQLLEQDAT